ncbi:MAG: hypothetical protein ABIH20_06970 [Candidatus Diapherotrites archaeon]
MIEKSDELLLKFFRNLNETERKNIGLMGGWAVHYTLKNKEVVHMGSRDIDIFFNPQKIKLKSLEDTLESMGFHRHSTFRWVKIFHSETEKELSTEESKKHPIHDLSYIYFDIATSTKMRHSMPEPLLKKVFDKEKEFIKIEEIEIMIPSAKILVEMKLKSTPNRSDAFKRTKDIADLYALLDTNQELWEIKQGLKIKTIGLNKKLVENFKEKLKRFKVDGTIATTASMLKINQIQVTSLLEKI